MVRLERQGGHVSTGDDDPAVAAGKKRVKHSIHAGAQIVAFLIEQPDGLAFFHDLEKSQRRRRRAGQIAIDRQTEFRNRCLRAFQRIEDKAPMHGRRFVGRERRAQARLDLAWNRRLGKDDERPFSLLDRRVGCMSF